MIGLTGSTGVLGKTFIRSCPGEQWSLFRGDVREFDAIRQWVADTPIDALLHLAAIVPVRRVEAEPRRAFETNVGGTLNICEAVRELAPTAWLFVASSSHVYAASDDPIREDSATDPLSLYGVTKLQAEQLALAYAHHFGLAICVGRIFSFSAAHQSEDYVLPSLVKRIRSCESGATLRLRGALQTRDFLTTSQIASIVWFLREHHVTGVINIGSGTGIRLLDLATALSTRMKRDDVRIVPDDTSNARLVADISRLLDLGWTPSPDLDELLDEMTGRA